MSDKSTACPPEHAASVAGEPDSPLARLVRDAEAGDSDARCELGRAFREGRLGLTRDAKQATDWFRKAAFRGHAEAQYQLGMMHLAGEGVARLAPLGVQWLLKASQKGHAEALYALGRIYAEGAKGVAKDERKALVCFLEAAKQGHEGALRKLRAAKAKKAETARQQEAARRREAAHRLEERCVAAERGDMEALFTLGGLCADGKGVGSARVLSCFREVAARGRARFRREAADRADERPDERADDQAGERTDDNVIEDSARTAEAWRIAADRGDAEAQYNLGLLYARGDAASGVPRDARQALEWFRRASARGHAKSWRELSAELLAEAGAGVEEIGAHLATARLLEKVWQQEEARTANKKPALVTVALMAAVREGNLGDVEDLLGAGADPNAGDRDGKSVLATAVMDEHLEVVRALLAAGADPHAGDRDGRPALMTAAMYGKPEMIEALLAAGADPDVRDADGEPALLGAAWCNGNPEVIGALLGAGADPNAVNRVGCTALMRAAEFNENPEVVGVLLGAGADPGIENSFGETALGLAKKRGRADMIGALNKKP